MPDEDVIARGRAIFDRLRSEEDAGSEAGEAASQDPDVGERAMDSPGVESMTSSPPEAESDAPHDLADATPPRDIGASGSIPASALPADAPDEGDAGADTTIASPAPGESAEPSGPGASPPEAPHAGAPPLSAPLSADAVEDAAAPEESARHVAEDAQAGATATSPEAEAPAAVLVPPDVDAEAIGDAVAGANGRKPKPPLPRILAIANQKGGVGKTTTAVNLSAGLAELGYRVLVVDLDPQGNATTGLGINGRTLDTSIYDVLIRDAALEDCVEPTSMRNLFVVPATIDLAGAEIELVPAFSRELKLRRALEAVRDDFDFVLIDCPPSLGLLTINAFSAASEVAVPIQCEYYALEGLGQLLRSINLVQANLNPGLELGTIILTMFDARTKLAEQVAGQVREHFGDVVCRNVVPRTVRLSEAPSFGQPITVFDPSSRGAIAYRELAKEVSGGAPQRTR